MAPDRVERARRFVQQHHRRIVEQRDAEAQSLLHSLRVRPDAARAAIRESDGREGTVDLRRPFRGVYPWELAVQPQHLARGEPRLITEELGQVADAAEGRFGTERAARERSDSA